MELKNVTFLVIGELYLAINTNLEKVFLLDNITFDVLKAIKDQYDMKNIEMQYGTEIVDKVIKNWQEFQRKGAKNVVYADESVKGIPEGTPWEDVIWGMKNTYKNLRFAVEITKEQPMDYLRYSLAQLAENCKRWGLEEEMSKLHI